MSRPLRWLSLASVVALTGCVGYYPDPYPSSPQPYYSGGGGGGYYEQPYYSAPYYGPAYGSTTIYYERYSPGYSYRPGYGYYYPRPGRPNDHHDDHHDDHDNHGGGWGDKGREVTGSNPGRYPHDRDDNRPSNNNNQPQANRGNGWSGRAPGGNSAPPQSQQRPQPQPQAQPQRDNNSPPPQRDNDRRGWGNKARDNQN
ncbi:hypothetical protein [Hydrocarboniphaga sp.]|uniref:hypothetical protein n=1 Tax=Hydrocarboniphaga sp. TaxID=2033016 RepID=UPI00262A7518|nr:hypothetical protein [Hydrocarboniphaga sp.]